MSVSEDEYVLQYDAITVSDKCFDAIQQQRNEAFTNLRIDLPGVHDGKHSLKLKIDTGASGNTLPIPHIEANVSPKDSKTTTKPRDTHCIQW